MNHLSAEEIFRSFFSPKPPYEISKPDDTGTDDAGHTRGPSNPPQNSAMSPLNTQNQQTNVQSRQASTTSNTTASNSKSRQPSTVSSTTAPSSEADRGTKRNWRGYVQLEPAAYSKQVHKANSYFDVDTSLDSRRSKRARLNRDEQHIVTPSTQSSRSSSSLSTAVNDDSEPERTFERLIADLKRSAPRTMATIRQRETTIEASGKPQSASRNPTARRKQTAKRLSALPKLPAFDHTRAAELIETLPVSPSGTTRNERVSESIERPQSATGMIDLPDEPDLPASDGAEDLSAVTKLPHFDHARAAELIETLPSSPSGTVESGHSTEDIERPKSAIGISRVSKRPKVSAPSAARYLPKVTELPQFDHACAAKLIKTLPLSPRGTEANERVVEEIERPKSAMGYISTEEIPLDASTAPPRPAADEPLYSPDSLPLIVDDDDESMSELEASVVPKRKNFSWKELRSLARAILAVDSPPPGFEDDEPTEDSRRSSAASSSAKDPVFDIDDADSASTAPTTLASDSSRVLDDDEEDEDDSFQQPRRTWLQWPSEAVRKNTSYGMRVYLQMKNTRTEQRAAELKRDFEMLKRKREREEKKGDGGKVVQGRVGKGKGRGKGNGSARGGGRGKRGGKVGRGGKR